MKKTTVCMSNGHEGPGWRLDTPGLLAINYCPDHWQKNWARWFVIHEWSGLHIVTCEKRAECVEIARRLGELDIDWTLPEADLAVPEVWDQVAPVLRAFREEVVAPTPTLEIA